MCWVFCFELMYCIFDIELMSIGFMKLIVDIFIDEIGDICFFCLVCVDGVLLLVYELGVYIDVIGLIGIMC